MKSHRAVSRILYEYVRGELSEANMRAVGSHIATCKRCSEDLAAIRKTAGMIDVNLKRPSELLDDHYWQLFAEKVDRRIHQNDQERAASSVLQRLLDALVVNRKPFGIGFASALTLVMIVFGIWSLWLRTPVPELPVGQQSSVNGTANVQKTALESRAQDYLDQSKVLLIGLMNTDVKSLSASGVSLEREKQISRRLVSESNVLTAGLNDPSQRRLKELISDLQLILVQIANLSERHDVQGIEIVKDGIEHNDILFKINLEEIQRTTKSAVPHDKTAKRST